MIWTKVKDSFDTVEVSEVLDLGFETKVVAVRDLNHTHMRVFRIARFAQYQEGTFPMDGINAYFHSGSYYTRGKEEDTILNLACREGWTSSIS